MCLTLSHSQLGGPLAILFVLGGHCCRWVPVLFCQKEGSASSFVKRKLASFFFCQKEAEKECALDKCLSQLGRGHFLYSKTPTFIPKNIFTLQTFGFYTNSYLFDQPPNFFNLKPPVPQTFKMVRIFCFWWSFTNPSQPQPNYTLERNMFLL